jgi:hypothetical protein
MSDNIKFQDLIEMIETDEARIYEDQPDILDYYFDDLDQATVINNFIDNYSYEDPDLPDAEDMLKILGEDDMYKILIRHSYCEITSDSFHTNWNDLYMVDLTEYEHQIDIEIDTPEATELLMLAELEETYPQAIQYREGDDYVNLWVYLYLGGLRLKLDVEAFEAEVSESLADIPDNIIEVDFKKRVKRGA